MFACVSPRPGGIRISGGWSGGKYLQVRCLPEGVVDVPGFGPPSGEPRDGGKRGPSITTSAPPVPSSIHVPIV